MPRISNDNDKDTGPCNELTLIISWTATDQATKRTLVIQLKQGVGPILVPPLENKVFDIVDEIPYGSVHEPISRTYTIIPWLIRQHTKWTTFRKQVEVSINVYLGTAKHGIRIYSHQPYPDSILGLRSDWFSHTDIYKALDVAMRVQEPPNKWHLAEM